MSFGSQNYARRFLAGAFVTASSLAAHAAEPVAQPGQEQNPQSMITAALRGDESQVRREIQRGVNPSADDYRALLLASRGGHDRVVEMLVREFGVNPNGKNNWPMAIAAINGKIGTMKLLKSLGADVNGHNGWALGNAAVSGSARSVQALLDDPDLAADINAGEGMGLASAIRSRDPAMVQIFIDRKARTDLVSVKAALDEIANSTEEPLRRIHTMVTVQPTTTPVPAAPAP